MPVIVPDNLPAIDILADENITVMSTSRGKSQDIRPLKVLILNLMPMKIATENQLIRLLSHTPLQVEATFLQTATHESKNATSEHLVSFYKAFDDIKDECFDGLIITGAPVENLPFEEVDYWPELCQILAWVKKHVFSTMHICWGAQAGLYYHHRIQKHALSEKLSGIYGHKLNNLNLNHPILRGFDEVYKVPHSRYTEVLATDIEQNDQLDILSTSEEAGVYLIATKDLRQVYVTGHPEYDADTLQLEYLRDVKKGIHPDIPVNYFLGDDPQNSVQNNWRGHAYLLFGNWLNHVYQEVPYEIEKIKEL
ncbi:MAG: homoserine O-succinyltransferase [Turicibacter sp.]|nr:homoserine O-succinyltransferase [Turicibacter sp.]